MLEEHAIYPNYQKAVQYLEQQRKEHTRLNDADNATLEGYIIFGGGHPVPPDEVEEFCDEFIEQERCYENPDTAAQLYELERYGYFYK